mgnify:CR=1 FL=1
MAPAVHDRIRVLVVDDLLATGGTWRWQMAQDARDQSHEIFWRQLLRWVAGSVEERVTLLTSRQTYEGGEEVLLRAEVRDRNYLPAAGAVVSAHVLGPGGVAETGRAGQLAIELSTIGPTLGRRVAATLAEKGIGFVGAPVSGGVEGAEVATLTIMAGGSADSFARAKPIFDLLGKNIFHVGEDPGAGYIVKLLNNFFIGFYTEAVAEALALADLLGFDKDKLFQILNVSYGRSGIYQRNYELFIAKERYEPGFALGLLLKDLTLARSMAEELGARLPIFERLLEVYRQSMEADYGTRDMAAQYLYVKSLQGRA